MTNQHKILKATFEEIQKRLALPLTKQPRFDEAVAQAILDYPTISPQMIGGMVTYWWHFDPVTQRGTFEEWLSDYSYKYFEMTLPDYNQGGSS